MKPSTATFMTACWIVPGFLDSHTALPQFGAQRADTLRLLKSQPAQVREPNGGRSRLPRSRLRIHRRHHNRGHDTVSKVGLPGDGLFTADQISILRISGVDLPSRFRPAADNDLSVRIRGVV